MRRSKTKSKLSITTWNTRGLITQDTRDVKLTHILKYNSDVVCLIDSHLKEKHLPQLRRNYISYNIYANTKGPTSSRGILVMIKKNKESLITFIKIKTTITRIIWLNVEKVIY